MALGFFKSLVDKFTGRPVDWDELEESLIRADLGVPMTLRILEALRARGGELTARTVVEVARNEILQVLPIGSPPIRPLPNRPKAILLVGVNGTGKTTSAAKLAHALVRDRHTALLVAADTFRAAAIEQLGVWGERIGVEVAKGQYNGDSAALCYDAYASAHRRNIEFLICDTAGRLHTKSNLMQELSKVVRTLAKHDPEAPHEKLLVVDATTGANALVQAKQFHETVGLTGIIVTKLDGSGRGGVVVAIQNELGLTPRYVGSGEKLEDFAPFDREDFVERML
ncbi:MAG: signal recognition particle-docking protein FtsY [Terrimicrobiaceae bacterium]|nr:signal recognition particle-docking protein FtsY [Terrimicrobiaceae bacterium]